MKKPIEKGNILKAVSICDSNCVFKAEVIERKKNFVTLLIDGQVIRKKVKVNHNNEEYVLALGNYSMAPAFSNQ